MIVVESTCIRRDKNRIKKVYVELRDVMIMRLYCHTELAKSGQKYADSNIQLLRGKRQQ